MTRTARPGNRFPPGSLNFNGFSFFNAVTFQIVLGAPVILYAKSLGASSLVLGTIASLTPFLSILQLVAARFLHRTGYRRFALAGWGARTAFVLLLAAVPVLPGLAAETRLMLVAVALFCFNLLRGFAAGAWLPWLTALVPEGVRGRFLSRDNAFMHLGCLAALLVSAWVMAGTVEAVEYAGVFAIGLVSGVVSLWFIGRIPDAQSPEERKDSGVAVPWAKMLRHPPFARLLWFTTFYMTVIGSLGVFTVEFQAVRGKYAEGMILLLSGLNFVGALAGLAWAGPRLDATGSKLWLGRALTLFAVVIAGWFLMAAGIWPVAGWLVGLLNFTGGLAGAVFGVANTRIVMGSVPVMGRNHFFALFTVVSSLGLGAAPVLWGAVLDALRSGGITVGGVMLDHYAVYFASLVVLALFDRLLVRRLHEGGAPPEVPLPATVEARPVAPAE
jgi:MFS family permease